MKCLSDVLIRRRLIARYAPPDPSPSIVEE